MNVCFEVSPDELKMAQKLFDDDFLGNYKNVDDVLFEFVSSFSLWLQFKLIEQHQNK